MGRSTWSNRFPAALVLTAMLGVGIAGCGSGDPPGAFATPEECFRFAQQAAERGDYAAAIECLTQESQDMMAGMMIQLGSLTKALSGMTAALGRDEDQARQLEEGLARIDAVMEKHGIDESALEESAAANAASADQSPAEQLEQVRQLAAPVENTSQFIVEMMAALQQLGDEQERAPLPGLAGSLQDVTLDGDQATATIQGEDGEMTPMQFRKTERGWRIHFDADAMTAAPAPEASPTL